MPLRQYFSGFVLFTRRRIHSVVIVNRTGGLEFISNELVASQAVAGCFREAGRGLASGGGHGEVFRHLFEVKN